MAAAAMVACEAEPVNNSDPETPEVPELQNGTYIYTINASIPEEESKPEQIAVKSNYDSEGLFSWSAGDAISVLFHNGDDNKFFTLTLTSGAGNKAASFSGEITSGYTIGASDGTVGDQKIWALFPASANHTYTAGELPSFYVQPSIDFTATHFSANLPMYALNNEEGTLSFSNLTSAYKFIVSGVKDGVSKITFSVTNASGMRDLSGSSVIKDDGYGHVYINYGWTRSGLTFTGNVTSNQAVFYVPCRFYAEFQPTITITNTATGIPIKTFVAGKSLTPEDFTTVKQITLDVSEANGGNYYVPAVTIDGVFTDWDGKADLPNTRLGGGTNYKINSWRMTSDALNVYIYAKLVKSQITNGSYIYIGFDTADGGSSHGGLANLESYAVVYTGVSGSDPLALIQGVDPRSTVNGSSDGTLQEWGVFGTGEDSDYIFVEMTIPRSKVGLTSAGTVKVAVACDYYDTIFQDLTLE